MFIFRSTVLELYLLPSHTKKISRGDVLRPTMEYYWGYLAESIEVSRRVSWKQKYKGSRCPLCQKSGIINLAEDEYVICFCRYYPLSIVLHADPEAESSQEHLYHFTLQPSYPSSPGLFNLDSQTIPYSWPPILSHTIIVPHEQNFRSISLGDYGTLIYDNSDLFLLRRTSEYGDTNATVCGLGLSSSNHDASCKPDIIRLQDRGDRRMNCVTQLALCERAGRIAVINQWKVLIWNFFLPQNSRLIVS